MLFVITNCNNFIVNSVWRGEFFEVSHFFQFVVKVWIYLRIVGIPSSGSMFVYIDVASDVNSCVPGGKLPWDFSFFRTTKESFT